MAEEPSLSYYLPIAGGRIIGFIPFPRVLVLCEMQSVSSSMWTRIAVFISYGDNDYTTGITNAWLCIHHLIVWSNSNFLHKSKWITLPTQSCLVLYFFSARWLHLLIMWLIVSSLSLHNLHLLFYCVLSILSLIWLVLLALFCADIMRDAVSL